MLLVREEHVSVRVRLWRLFGAAFLRGVAQAVERPTGGGRGIEALTRALLEWGSRGTRQQRDATRPLPSGFALRRAWRLCEGAARVAPDVLELIMARRNFIKVNTHADLPKEGQEVEVKWGGGRKVYRGTLVDYASGDWQLPSFRTRDVTHWRPL